MDNKREQLFLEWKEYWKKSDDPGPPKSDENWHRQYVEEILFFSQGARTIVDAGCGDGSVLVEIADRFDKIIGLDYSEAMIEAAKLRVEESGAKNIVLHSMELEDIDKVVLAPVDLIYNSQVVQFLDMEKLRRFLGKCLNLINANGKIALLNILNRKAFDLYSIEYYKNNNAFGVWQLMLKLARYKFWTFRKGLFNDLTSPEFSIGYWYTKDEIYDLAMELGCEVRFYNSMCDEFGYRFHAIMYLKK